MKIINLIKNLKNSKQLIQIRLALVKLRNSNQLTQIRLALVKLRNSNQLTQIRLGLVKIKNQIKITAIENTKRHKKILVIAILVLCILVIFMLLKDPNEKNDIELEKTGIIDPLIEMVPNESNVVEPPKQTKKTRVKTDIKKTAKKEVKKKTPLDLPSKKLEPKKVVKEPENVVWELHNGLISIKTNQPLNLDKVINLIQNTYRVEKMLSLIIGKEWKNVSIKKKTKLVNIFTEYISKNYIRRFRQINKPVFMTNEVKDVGKNYKMVRAQLIVANEKVSINYLLSEINGYWRIFDVLLAGSVSEIATKKSEFSSFILESNVDLLIEAIKKKNKTLLSE